MSHFHQGHSHEGIGDEHGEHSHGHDMSAIAANLEWLTFKSVGVDIGSSTSHLMFSELTLERQGRELNSRYVVVQREVLYRSKIIHTPYKDRDTIDVQALSTFIANSYKEAGFTSKSVDTGAVICTGEAVKKKNSEAITRLFSSEGGKFVCATAGAHLEGILAAHGSGAVERSRSEGTVMNVDVGGGTSKVTIVKKGSVVETGAINVGARLIAWDSHGVLARIEEPARKIADSVGVSLELGKKLSDPEKKLLSQKLGEVLFEYLKRDGLSELARGLLITEPLRYSDKIDEILFSGGVAEYVYGTETHDFGDLGPIMGEEIAMRVPSLGIKLGQPSEKIRATVIGASQYTIQVSSSTVFVSSPSVLPLRDRQVVATQFLDSKEVTAEMVDIQIGEALNRSDLSGTSAEETRSRPIALYVKAPTEVSYNSMHALANGISSALRSRGDTGPWVLVFDQDIGGMVGQIMKHELNVSADIVVIDEIEVGELDFIDVGEILPNRNAVPVVVKSIVFG